MSHRIQEYVRVSAGRGRTVERIGPFLATFTGHDPSPFLNYAIPDTGAEPGPDDVRELVAAFERHDRLPRLEFLPGLSPAVEPVLLAGGFEVEQRLPLMECPPGAAVDQPVPAGIELLTPRTDEEHLGMLTAQHEAFGQPPPEPAHVAAARSSTESGSIHLFARDAATGEPVGGGGALAVVDGISEVAGIAVRPKYEKRGVGGVISLHLTRAAHAAGAEVVYLTPAGDAQERVYARVGYRRTDSMLFMRRPQ